MLIRKGTEEFDYRSPADTQIDEHGPIIELGWYAFDVR